MSNKPLDIAKNVVVGLVVLTIIMYMLMPNAFETHVLMNIPMYRRNILKSLAHTDPQLRDEIAKLKVDLAKALVEQTAEKNEIAKLKVELNAALLTNLVHNDPKLQSEINNLNASLDKTISNYKTYLCANKHKLKDMISEELGLMRDSEKQEICSKAMWDGARLQLANMSMRSEIIINASDRYVSGGNVITSDRYKSVPREGYERWSELAGRIIIIGEYITSEYFCKNGTFQVSDFKQYLFDMIDDLCADKNGDLSKFLTQTYRYMIQKPASYLKK